MEDLENNVSDLQVDVSNVYYALKFINASKERVSELSTALDNIDLRGVALRNSGLFSNAKTTVKKILNETLTDIGEKLENTKNVIIENDVEALLLFAYLDGEFNDEFGNFSEEKVNEYIERKNQELYDEAVKKAEEEHNNNFNNDPSYRYDCILANLLSQNGYESLQQIDEKKEEFMTKIRDLQKRKNEILYSDAQMTLKFLDIMDVSNNYTATDFNSLSKREILVYRYIDENGLEIYCDSQLAIPNQYIGTAEALTYSDMCGGTELYNKVKSGFEDNLFYSRSLPSYLTGNSYIMSGVGTTGSYSKTDYYEEFYNEVTNITIDEQSKLEEINTMLSSAEGELSNLVSLKQGILDYAHYYTYDEYGYILRDDFEENCKNISEDEIDAAINNIKNKPKFSSTNNDNIPGALSSAYTSTSITLDTREEEMQVIYSLISGSDKFYFGQGSVSYVDENGKQIYLESKDDLFSNYSMWASEMSEKQKQIFYYNWNTGGYEAAYEYLDSISNVLDSTYIVNQTKRDQEFASAHPGTASTLSVLMAPVEGLDALRYSMQQKFNDDKMYRSQLYSVGDTMRAQVSTDIATSGKTGAEVNAFMYNVSMSVLDNLYSMLLTGGSPGASGIILGVGGYDNSINDALNRGLTDDQARLYATSMAVVEAATESWSLDKLVDIKWLKNLDGQKTLTQILGKTLDQAKSEGFEELTSSIVGEWVDQLIAGENSAFNLSVQDYIAQGYTEEQALALAQKDQLLNFGESFLSGFTSGGMTGGGKITGSYISYVHQNHKNKNMFIDSLGSVVSENIKSKNYDVAIDAIMNQEGKTNAEKALYANTVIAALENFQVIDGDMKQKLSDSVKSFVESHPDVKNVVVGLENIIDNNPVDTVVIDDGEMSESELDKVTAGVPTSENTYFHTLGDLNNDSNVAVDENVTENLEEEPTVGPVWSTSTSEKRDNLIFELNQKISALGLNMKQYLANCAGIVKLNPIVKHTIHNVAVGVYNKAISSEPLISSFLQSLVTDDVQLAGFEHRFKSVDSIARKISLNFGKSIYVSESDVMYYANQINDSLRYTLVLNESNYSSQLYYNLQKFINNGYSIDWINNKWGDPIYQGINVSMTSPTGVKMEVQFHTQDSFNVKEKFNHDYYEIVRSNYPSAEIRNLAIEIMKLNQQMYVNTITDMVGMDYNTIMNNAVKYSKFKEYTSYYDFVSHNNQKAQNWLSALSSDVKDIIYAYVGENFSSKGNYKAVNGLLRGTLIDYDKKIISYRGTGGYLNTLSFDEFFYKYNMTVQDFYQMQEDAAMKLNSAIKKSTLDEDIVLFRGVNWDALSSFGIKKGDSADIIYAKLISKGDTFCDPGFMSTSPVATWITSCKPIELVMKCKAGMAAADLNYFNAGEHEVLLSAGQEFYIESVQEENGRILIYLMSK